MAEKCARIVSENRSLHQSFASPAAAVISTGTPQGVAFGGRFPYLKAGDVVEIEIDGLGHQRQEFVAWEAGR